MIRLKISTKILIYFLLVSLVPLFIANFVLVSSAHSQLLKAAGSQQQAVANDLSDRVSNYLATKIQTLVRASQLDSSGSFTEADLEQDLAVILNNDKDMQRLAIVSGTGQDKVVFTRSGQSSTLLNESNTDAFKAVGFLSGKAFVSSVSYNSSHQPVITIAVPVLDSNFSQHLKDLNGANFGTYTSPSDLQGSVIASYNMSNLWNSVLSTKVGKGGYAYVVDGLGNVVAHPNAQFVAAHPKLSNVQAVKNFINGDLNTVQTKSETGLQVISTPRDISDSGWGVIVEEPASSVYAGVNSYIKLAVIIGTSAAAFAVALSIFFRKQLIDPIRKLSAGAKQLGTGEFNEPIQIDTRDELHDLADTFNSMGLSIKKLVSDLRTKNKTLEVEQEKLNNIIESVSDGVLALNSKKIVISANPPAAKLIGKSVDQIVGKDMSELYKLTYNDTAFMPSIEHPGSYHFSDIALKQGDTLHYLDLMISVIPHEDSDVAAIITIRDFTQSRELDFMKLDFVAIAAHELRTPLTVVRGYLDMIKREAVKKFTINNLENLQKSMEGTEQLRDLINKLLNIARIERGEMDIFIEKLNLVNIVKENAKQHESPANRKELRIKMEISADPYTYVAADPASIVEVLNNLIGNAIKYTPKGGEITIQVSADKQSARVRVIDNGPGVPEELRERLFTKFYRAQRSLISGTRGTGLGLYISKTIIELQQGTIGFEPAESTKGSVFYFTLPIYDPLKYDKLVAKDKQLGGVHGWFKKHNDSRG